MEREFLLAPLMLEDGIHVVYIATWFEQKWVRRSGWRYRIRKVDMRSGVTEDNTYQIVGIVEESPVYGDPTSACMEYVDKYKVRPNPKALRRFPSED